ncbi:hypothetical protein RJ639_017455 [Escallonia herrerae]|uniref:PUM-HD domain-containing protein n=1 Tax=Escallonia herrerae TaxID=1293975 RepID=A0AA89AMJ9_9ASTE|nr:hypothetical protein RJ639_017455 [Escallonia herrerae]
MKDDEELEMLLGEIPHATSLNLHNTHSNGHGRDHVHGGTMSGIDDDDPLSNCKFTRASPASGFSLQSDGSSSSLFSCGHSWSDNGSPPSPLEELKSHISYGNTQYPHGMLLDVKLPDSYVWKKANANMINELNLSRNFKRIYISQEDKNVSADPNTFQFCDRSGIGSNGINEGYGDFDNYRKVVPHYGVIQSFIPRSPINYNGEMNSALMGLQQEDMLSNLSGPRYNSGQYNGLISQSYYGDSQMISPCLGTRDQAGYCFQRGIAVSNLATQVTRPSVADTVLYAQQNGLNLLEKRSAPISNMSHLTHQRPQLNVENNLHNCPRRSTASSNFRVTQGGLQAFNKEGSLIIPGECLNYVMNDRLGCSKGHGSKSSKNEIAAGKPQEKRSQLDSRPLFAGAYENGHSVRNHSPFSLQLKFNTLAESQGYIYFLAKDQYGCRFLQRMFDEGTPQDVQTIFNEIIDHVVELAVNPFGNYLMQKLLEVSNEEQRMQILLMVTKEPGQLVRISLNTHGTRVVQKLIESLTTKQQILLVISALQPGFLSLIKDLNGNHVVQRCLQCLSSEDNEFIFVAAAKYCVDIATHQHGCCVLQRCISHSSGEHQENLVAEISTNGLLLAQDAFGNYVLQYILELKIPYATSKLVSQFEGNFVHLSTQKFSSHVVEKCLAVLSHEVRSKIIHELLSADHFEQLLQDPHANYVVQTALRVSEGPLHNLLADAIESHKAISRNSPYSKRIFSHKLLKK